MLIGFTAPVFAMFTFNEHIKQWKQEMCQVLVLAEKGISLTTVFDLASAEQRAPFMVYVIWNHPRHKLRLRDKIF